MNARVNRNQNIKNQSLVVQAFLSLWKLSRLILKKLMDSGGSNGIYL